MVFKESTNSSKYGTSLSWIVAPDFENSSINVNANVSGNTLTLIEPPLFTIVFCKSIAAFKISGGLSVVGS